MPYFPVDRLVERYPLLRYFSTRLSTVQRLSTFRVFATRDYRDHCMCTFFIQISVYRVYPEDGVFRIQRLYYKVGTTSNPHSITSEELIDCLKIISQYCK